MIITYRLDESTYPTVPVVHDCVICDVRADGEFLMFTFEPNIGEHDSISHIRPGARSLTIRYHLVDDIEVFAWKRRLPFTRTEGYVARSVTWLAKMAKGRLEYLYHNVGYRSIVLKLWSAGQIIVDVCADYLEYAWDE